MDAPIRVGNAPVRSKSLSEQVTANPTNAGIRCVRWMVRVFWKTSAKQVTGLAARYMTERPVSGCPSNW